MISDRADFNANLYFYLCKRHWTRVHFLRLKARIHGAALQLVARKCFVASWKALLHFTTRVVSCGNMLHKVELMSTTYNMLLQLSHKKYAQQPFSTCNATLLHDNCSPYYLVFKGALSFLIVSIAKEAAPIHFRGCAAFTPHRPPPPQKKRLTSSSAPSFPLNFCVHLD